MQDLPDKISLLKAVARFLADDRFKKEIRDPALAFRMKIATHVLETVAREDQLGEAHDTAELKRLETLFALPASEAELSSGTRQARIKSLNTKLAEELRARFDVPGAHAHLKATLAEKLSVTQPRFDLKDEID
jgi:hypothetical protein